MDASPSCWLWGTLPLQPSLGLLFSSPSSEERKTTFALPKHKYFMGWHPAASAISVPSSMTPTGSDSDSLVTPPHPRTSQHYLFSKWPLLQEAGGGGREQMRGMVLFPASHSSDTEDQLSTMPGHILLLFVTKLLNIHFPLFLPTAHKT